MKRVLLAAILGLICVRADATVLYQQLPDPDGGSYRSSWWDPDGSNYDEYVWDRFEIGFDADIDSVQWRGTYKPAYGGDTPVVNFTVAIYASSVGGTQPDVSHAPLVEYQTGGNAGQTYAGVFGGATMYDYSFTLPVAFHAQAGVPYWVQIEGWQNGYPGWSLAVGTGGDNYHFRCQHTTSDYLEGVPTGCYFTAPSGDAAFALLTSVVTAVEADGGSAGFALSGAMPNPSHGDRLELSFRLPGDAEAELALFDASGRRVTSVDVGALGAGWHLVDLAAGAPIEPGVYFARLSQRGASQGTKVIVIR